MIAETLRRMERGGNAELSRRLESRVSQEGRHFYANLFRAAGAVLRGRSLEPELSSDEAKDAVDHELRFVCKDGDLKTFVDVMRDVSLA